MDLEILVRNPGISLENFNLPNNYPLKSEAFTFFSCHNSR